jgi:hypothetical protein
MKTFIDLFPILSRKLVIKFLTIIANLHKKIGLCGCYTASERMESLNNALVIEKSISILEVEIAKIKYNRLKK